MNIGKFFGSAAMSAIREWNPLSQEAYERRDRNKAYRKARRKAKRGETLTEQESQILNTTQEVDMLAGKKTYLGIAAAGLGMVLGWLGLGECDPAVADAACQNADQIGARIVAAVNEIIMIGGLLFAAYGRAKAKPAA